MNLSRDSCTWTNGGGSVGNSPKACGREADEQERKHAKHHANSLHFVSISSYECIDSESFHGVANKKGQGQEREVHKHVTFAKALCWARGCVGGKLANGKTKENRQGKRCE